jgi:hypothetical protein
MHGSAQRLGWLAFVLVVPAIACTGVASDPGGGHAAAGTGPGASGAGATAGSGTGVAGAPAAGSPAVGGAGAPAGGAVEAGGAGASGAGAPAGGSLGASGSPGRAGAAGQGTGTGGAMVSALCPANALICEDFEAGTLTKWGQANVQQATLTVDSRQAAHGTKSLSITTPAMGRGGFLQAKGAPLFPLPNKTIWGRIMVFFESTSDGHTDFVRGAPTNGTPLYNVGEQHHEILLNYYNGAASDCWARPKPGKPVDLNKWTCWEWSFDGNTNSMQFWIDGTLSRTVTSTGDGCLSNPTQVWTAPTFAALDIGQYIAEVQPTTMQMWIDDIAVGNQSRIGCPMP